MDLYDQLLRPDRRNARTKSRFQVGQYGGALRQRQFGNFECRHCGQLVSADPLASGVQNRNHCPYCLWSKHVDLREPGDRLAACKGPMAPVGLTFKRRLKKYACAQPGELMLVHQCTVCGVLSINRIAADDGSAALWDVYEACLALPPSLLAQAQAAGIELLTEAAREVIQARLFGG